MAMEIGGNYGEIEEDLGKTERISSGTIRYLIRICTLITKCFLQNIVLLLYMYGEEILTEKWIKRTGEEYLADEAQEGGDITEGSTGEGDILRAARGDEDMTEGSTGRRRYD